MTVVAVAGVTSEMARRARTVTGGILKVEATELSSYLVGRYEESLAL